MKTGGEVGCGLGCEVGCDAGCNTAGAVLGEAACDKAGDAVGDVAASGLAVAGALAGRLGVTLLAAALVVIAGRFAGILLALGARFSLGLGGCVRGIAGGLLVTQVSCNGPGVFAASGRSAVIARPAQASVWIAAETANAGQRRVGCSR